MLSEEELAGVPLLVFCNKQDIEGALKPEEISEQLGLAGGEKGRDWSVRGSCAIEGKGIEEGLDWCVTNKMWAFSITDKLLQACQCDTEEIRTPLMIISLLLSSTC
jgi:signal recognition particle receptor subunit beta